MYFLLFLFFLSPLIIDFFQDWPTHFQNLSAPAVNTCNNNNNNNKNNILFMSWWHQNILLKYHVVQKINTWKVKWIWFQTLRFEFHAGLPKHPESYMYSFERWCTIHVPLRTNDWISVSINYLSWWKISWSTCTMYVCNTWTEKVQK